MVTYNRLYDASLPTSINAGSPIHGDPLDSWTNTGTSGGTWTITQGTAAHRPTWQDNIQNGLAVVSFDGIDDRLVRTGVTADNRPQPNVVIAVCKFEGNTGTSTRYLLHTGSGSSSQRNWLWVENGQWEMFAGGQRLSGSPVTNDPVIVVAVFDGVNSILRVGGVETTGSVDGSVGQQGISIGARDDGSEPFPGWIGQLGYLNTRPTAQEIEDEEARLTAKWIGGGGGQVGESPVASAGVDQGVAVGSLVTLDASGSTDLEDTGGTADDAGTALLAYTWTVVSAPEVVTFSDDTSRFPTFTPATIGQYTLQVLVTDSDSNSDIDDVIVVVSQTADSIPPVVDGLLRQYDDSTWTGELGSAITEWKNLGEQGSAWDVPVAAGADAPTLTSVNGRKAPLFSPTTALRLPSTQTVSQPTTAFVVARLDAADPSTVVAHLLEGANGSSGRNLIHVRDNGYLVNAGLSVTGGTPDNDLHVITIVFNGASSEMRIDGVQILSGDFGSVGLEGESIGCHRSLNTEGWIGPICTRLLYSGARSAQEITDTETWLAGRWRPTFVANPPVADAGDPVTVSTGQHVQLDGSGSSDIEDTGGAPDDGIDAILTYAWNVQSAPESVTLDAPTGRYPTFTPNTAGDYVIRVLVTDSDGNQIEDTVTITAVQVGAATVQNYWVGAVTGTSARITAKADADSELRVLVDTDPAFSNPIISNTVTVSTTTDRTAHLDVTGLTADTTHNYKVQVNGADTGGVTGAFKTFPVGASNLRICFGSCATNASNSTLFATVESRAPDVFIHHGDLHYRDPIDTEQGFFTAYDEVLAQPNQASLYASIPLAYTWDDHDYGTNDGDITSPSRVPARSSYRKRVPHYPLPAGAGDQPIHQAFTMGRVRVLLTDVQSARSPKTDTDDANKTMLGTVQKQWFKDEITAAAADSSIAMILWVNPRPWIGATTVGADFWAGYSTERTELADHIANTSGALGKIVMISGDAHMYAVDDGTNSDYSTAQIGGFPAFVAAPFDRSSSVKGGPYSHGISSSGHHFGQLDIVDSGGDLQVTVTGNGSNGAEVTDPAAYTFTITAASSLLSPENLHVRSATDTTVDLGWDSVEGAAKYQIERDGIVIATIEV